MPENNHRDTTRASDAGFVDGRNRVTGALTFVNDVRCDSALHVAFTLADHEHALLRHVDLTPALEIPGVVAAISGADIGPRRIGRAVRDYPVLAYERVLFNGQRVAAVAAVDRETARYAADLVDVDYEPLPPVRDPDEAVAAGAPVLHPDYASYTGGLANRSHPNLQGRWELSHGDAAAGFEESTDVYESEFVTTRCHAVSLEPHACLIVPGPRRVDVYSTHKAPYELRRDLGLISNRPADDFAIHSVHIGGDFGSKGFPYIETACYLLAVATQRPVRCVLSFYDEFVSTGARHPAVFRFRTGLIGGRMHAHETDVVLDGGAFAALKAHPLAVVPAIHAPVELYEVPHVYEQCTSYYTNSLPGAHVRSPGEFQATFASESHIDLIARARGTDPIQFRLENTQKPALHRLLHEMEAKVADWRSEPAPDTGIGVAICWRDAGGGESTALCRARIDGSIEVAVAVPDQGVGAYTLIRRLAAEALQVPADAVSIRAAGTDGGLPDSGAGASRVTNIVGRAAVQACNALVDKLGGLPTDGESGANWLVGRLQSLGEDELEATGSWAMGWPTPPDLDVRSYAGIAMQVAVDRETGEFTVRRAFVVADTGVVVNRVGHRGQLEGGFIYGLSQATLEELVVEQGQVVTASLGDYRIISAADIPPLEVMVIEPDAEEAFTGMRSVGELTNVGVAPALANAIHDAVGVRIVELPITPERVHRASSAMTSTPA